MHSRLLMLGVAALSVTLTYFFTTGNLDAQNSSSGRKIGFVKVKIIFKDYKKLKVAEQKIKQETQVEMAQVKQLEEKVKQLREEIPLYRPGSTIRKRKEQDLTDNLFDIKYRKDKINFYLVQKTKSVIEKTYQKIVTTVEKYAQKNNFFMVLKVGDADFFGSRNAEALRMEINTRDVLFWQKKDDITQEIIKVLNK